MKNVSFQLKNTKFSRPFLNYFLTKINSYASKSTSVTWFCLFSSKCRVFLGFQSTGYITRIFHSELFEKFTQNTTIDTFNLKIPHFYKRKKKEREGDQFFILTTIILRNFLCLWIRIASIISQEVKSFNKKSESCILHRLENTFFTT